MAVVLVTGAAGFVGSHLLPLLSSRQEVVAWSRSAPSAELGELADWRQVDLLDRAGVRNAILEQPPSAVYHLAGVAHVAESFDDILQTLAGNVLATHYLFDALRRANASCRVLVPGSATVYAPSDRPIAEDGAIAPASPYALSKLAQEQLSLRAMREDGVEVIVTRSFNHTGPRQTPAFVAPSMARQIALVERGTAEPTIRVGNLDARRDLTDVRDVVRAYEALMTSGVPGTIYNVASGQGRTIGSLLDALISRARVPVRVETDPGRLRAQDTPALVGDATRLCDATGWRPAISFDRMLDDLLEYWRSQVILQQS